MRSGRRWDPQFEDEPPGGDLISRRVETEIAADLEDADQAPILAVVDLESGPRNSIAQAPPDAVFRGEDRVRDRFALRDHDHVSIGSERGQRLERHSVRSDSGDEPRS